MKTVYPDSDHAGTFLEASRCPYFDDGRTATTEFLLSHRLGEQDFHAYLARGYRRFGNALFRNACEGCAACRPLRIETRNFKLSKSQRRTLRRNRDIHVEILSPPVITIEKVKLFMKYQNSKHGEEREPSDYATHISCCHYGYGKTIEMNYFIGGRLIAVGIVDEGRDCLSSNYFYYDTDLLERRPGVFSILEEISLARRLGKRFFYLGFFIEENPKMSYKRFFRPNQVLHEGQWRVFQTEYLTEVREGT